MIIAQFSKYKVIQIPTVVSNEISDISDRGANPKKFTFTGSA